MTRPPPPPCHVSYPVASPVHFGHFAAQPTSRDSSCVETGAGRRRVSDKVKRNAFRQNRTEHSPPPGKSDLFEPGIPTLRSRLAQPLFKVTASLSLPFSLPLKVFYLSESSFVAVSRNRSGFLWRWRRTDRRTVHVRPTVRSSGGLPACLPE